MKMVHSLRKNDDNKNETKRWNEIDVLYTLGTLLVFCIIDIYINLLLPTIIRWQEEQ